MKPARSGFALAMVALLMLVLGSVGTAALFLGSNSFLMANYKERQSTLGAVADAGLDLARARINGNKTLYPDTSFTELESGVTVTDAGGTVIPGVKRYTYIGPTGVTTGQYGVFGTIVSVAQAGNGDRVVRRLEINQESFAKFAYFTDVEPSSIAFGGGDQLFGPVHSNDVIQIYSSGATFHGPVTTARTINGTNNGTFRQGYTERAPRIAMPQTADLDKLRQHAQAGSTAFVGSAGGGAGQATLRLEFITINVDGAPEGFIRVYRSNNAAFVTAHVPTGGMRNSMNCGHFHVGSDFVSAAAHPTSGTDSWQNALAAANRRCFLGGADELSDGVFTANDGVGQYERWVRGADPALSFRPDAAYLFPISRKFNPGFKGVIFVDGKVAISGTLRGRVTIASTSSIILADDMRYNTDPGAGSCVDILGLFSGTDVVVADNTLNAPLQPNGTGAFLTFDETRDEFLHGVVLALQNFEVENYAAGSSNAQACESRAWGRGCLYLTGGVIQSQRGAVGTAGGTGYLKRYSYDPCAAQQPPPYFPTTGHFVRGRLIEVDPTGFTPKALFDLLTPDK